MSQHLVAVLEITAVIWGCALFLGLVLYGLEALWIHVERHMK